MLPMPQAMRWRFLQEVSTAGTVTPLMPPTVCVDVRYCLICG